MNKKILPHLVAVLLTCAIIGFVAMLAMQPTNPIQKYMNDFGGNEQVYAEILALSDCAALQAKFDQAEANLNEPGTEQYRWGLGYMQAASDRMNELRCYK